MGREKRKRKKEKNCLRGPLINKYDSFETQSYVFLFVTLIHKRPLKISPVYYRQETLDPKITRTLGKTTQVTDEPTTKVSMVLTLRQPKVTMDS